LARGEIGFDIFLDMDGKLCGPATLFGGSFDSERFGLDQRKLCRNVKTVRGEKQNCQR
jgi:hypothetical protein